MTRMMSAAAITPHTANVHSGDAELARVTGARVPTGVPVTIPNPVIERPRYTGTGGSGRNPRSRPAYARRSTQANPASRTQAPRRDRVAA
jgi:hypothetical protein